MDKATEEMIMPPEDQMGEALLALNERQRKFVCALAAFGGNLARSYLYAGYTAKNEATANACASRLHTRADVKAAIAEEMDRRLKTHGVVIAMSRLIEKADMGNVQAINSILDRGGFHTKTEQTITVKDERTANEILGRVKELMATNGLAPRSLPAPIDAEYTDVDPNDLSDIL